MKICKNCVLPETFPNIRFNEEGICNYCLEFKTKKNWHEEKQKYLNRFKALIKEHKGKQPIDCLVAYSGGKDSTYTLYILKEQFNLRLLALTFDNGFVSPKALENMKKVTEALDIDHIVIKPRFELLKKIFVASAKQTLYPKKALDRASTICTSCISFVKSLSLKTAIEKHIPFIAFGWSPGQAPLPSSVLKTNPLLIRTTQKVIEDTLKKIVGNEIKPYFLENHHFEKAELFPYLIHPLAFLEYNEEAILEKIKQLGWEKPDDTDPNSTNCLLNAFANKLHKEQFHFHPYAFEIAGLVRTGIMSREEGLKRLNQPENPKIIEWVKKRLGL